MPEGSSITHCLTRPLTKHTTARSLIDKTRLHSGHQSTLRPVFFNTDRPLYDRGSCWSKTSGNCHEAFEDANRSTSQQLVFTKLYLGLLKRKDVLTIYLFRECSPPSTPSSYFSSSHPGHNGESSAFFSLNLMPPLLLHPPSTCPPSLHPRIFVQGFFFFSLLLLFLLLGSTITKIPGPVCLRSAQLFSTYSNHLNLATQTLFPSCSPLA